MDKKSTLLFITMKKNKAVFLNGDGAITENLDINFPDKIKSHSEIFDALKIISEYNFLIFIIANQRTTSGKFISKNELEKVPKLIQQLNAKSIKIVEIFAHDSNHNCEYRKSPTYFLRKAIEKYDINLKDSYIIGNHPSNFIMTQKYPIKSLYLLSGNGLKYRNEAEKTNAKILPDILSAAEFIQINENLQKIYNNNNELEEKILQASLVIKNNGTVVMPTETVYGLAANAENRKAVEKIFSIKKRPSYDPLIVHISNFEMLNKIVLEIPAKAKILMENLWPGPLTIVLRKKQIIPDIVTANLPSVAVRMPMHPIALKLIEYSGPIAAPSANLFSQLSPTRYSDISKEIIQNANFAINGGDCIKGLESTIISFLNEDKPQLLRAGSISVEKIERLIGKISIKKSSTQSSEAPGMQKKHYSPKTPIFIIKSPNDISDEKKIKSALLSFKKISPKQVSQFKITKLLTSDCDFRKAAAQLYSTLAELDKLKLKAIYTILPKKKGLGLAIADRLIRASEK